MKQDSDNLMKFFKNNNAPIFKCDEKFNVLEVNSYIKDNDISINIGDNLYNVSAVNSDLLDTALINLKKSLPFYSTNFLINLTKTTIYFIPICEKDEKFNYILCSIVPPENTDLNFNSNSFPNIIHKAYNEPTTQIVNRLYPVAYKLEQAEDYESLAELNSIMQCCYKMLRVSNTATTYYKLINNEVSFKNKKILLNHYLRDLLSALQVMFIDCGYHIVYDIINKPIIVNCDEEYLSVALFHIISNSCLYSPKNSTIKITLSQNNDTANITVTDEGTGINQSNLQNIFHPYYSNKGLISANDVDGLGLGLPIVKNIIDKFNGNIFITSETNKGTTIAISLPLSDDSDISLELKSNTRKYVTNKFSDMYIYFSEICKMTHF